MDAQTGSSDAPFTRGCAKSRLRLVNIAMREAKRRECPYGDKCLYAESVEGHIDHYDSAPCLGCCDMCGQQALCQYLCNRVKEVIERE